MDVWEQIKDRLSTRLTWESFQSWFTKANLHSQDSRSICVSVPNAETKEWIEREYADQVRAVIRDLKLPVQEVIYVVAATAAPANGAADLRGASDSVSFSESLFGSSTSHLNTRYTFDSFVVGSCNQFAHAAAAAVANRPARSYNPLFIYGGVGMGKTHLIHAIGHALSGTFGSLRVVYTTSERFMNQLITCIRNERMALFHQYYRSADALLVDDIHILAGKERTQEEFFHTFNELYDHQKQIVLSSDSAPKNTPGLVDRLRSRFEWGLMVDVQAPDLETKVAILDKKADEEGIELPDDVRIFIATKTKSNVRELEGALTKLIAYSSVTSSRISLDMAKQLLRHLSAGTERKISIESIIKAVAEKFSLQPAQLKQKSNMRNIAYPRQVAMYLVKELTDSSLPEIGRAFGGKHHTTVLHSVQKIDREKAHNPNLHKIINSVIDSFN
ncbi:MAG: chromosomal replication initiator protein DnaA [Acidobacteriia bacterium]|nr:chromosomal replication initiator protein DnaA [Terriglobia bacterium]